MTNIFETLSNINVNDLTEKKNNLTYLSWANAWATLLEIYPLATYETHEFNGVPFLQTDNGCFVKVSVTIEGLTRTEIMPVLNYANKPIQNPNSFEINASHKRCLAKAIALHGLGLYIYAGEDLPACESLQLKLEKKPVTAPANNLATNEQKDKIKRLMEVTKTDKEQMQYICKENGCAGNTFTTITNKDADKIIEALILIDDFNNG